MKPITSSTIRGEMPVDTVTAQNFYAKRKMIPATPDPSSEKKGRNGDDKRRKKKTKKETKMKRKNSKRSRKSRAGDTSSDDSSAFEMATYDARKEKSRLAGDAEVGPGVPVWKSSLQVKSELDHEHDRRSRRRQAPISGSKKKKLKVIGPLKDLFTRVVAYKSYRLADKSAR